MLRQCFLPDTTDEALTKYLIDEGMAGMVCRKLKAKDGQVFKTAAFYVTCVLESAELFYDEARGLMVLSA